MSEIIFQIEEPPEGGYTAQALGHAIFTEAESLDELRENVRDAVRCHFDAYVSERQDDFNLAKLVGKRYRERRIKVMLDEL